MEHCTLCGNRRLSRVAPPCDRRFYHHCPHCHLIFADRRFLLSPEAERARYALHRNGLDHAGYVAFLRRVIDPCIPLLHHNMRGLDYGCGPTPSLSKLLARQGIRCYDFDPLFGFSHPFQDYDFIFATECIEHFHLPGEELARMSGLLRPGGYLAIMTEHWESMDSFNHWWYKRDQTHVSFFHEDTFRFICESFHYEVRFTDHRRVVILKKLR